MLDLHAPLRTLASLLLAALLLPPLHQDAQKQPSQPPAEDSPASIGLVLDNSGSMRAKLDSAVAALRELVEASNPQDEFFVINFNDDAYLDVDFTSNQKSVFEALGRADARSGTALNDAVIASADHFKKGSKYKKRALVVVTDGFDNMSHLSAKQMLKELHGPDMPAVYCIGLFDPGKERRAGRALDMLAQETGGTALYPQNEKQLHETAQQIAQEIRKR